MLDFNRFFKSGVKKEVEVALWEWGHLFWKQAEFDLCIPPYVLPSGCDTAAGKSIRPGWQNVPLDCSQWGVKPCGGWSKTTPDATQPRLVESMERKSEGADEWPWTELFLSNYQAWGSSLSPRDPSDVTRSALISQSSQSGKRLPHMMDRSEKDKVKVKSSVTCGKLQVIKTETYVTSLHPHLFCSLLLWFSASGKLFRTSGEMYLTDETGSCVTSCLHISAVTWREQPPDQMAGRPLI